MVEEKAGSGGLSVLRESVLTLWFLNVSLLGNDHRQQIPEFYSKIIVGFLGTKTKAGVKIWFPHFPEHYAHILKDETEDISGSFDVKRKYLKRDCVNIKINLNGRTSWKIYLQYL